MERPHQHRGRTAGLPIDRVSLQYGDSDLPDSPMAGGSCQTVSIAAAVQAAIEKAHRRLRVRGQGPPSPLRERRGRSLRMRADSCVPTIQLGATYTAILKAAGRRVEAEASAKSRASWKAPAGRMARSFVKWHQPERARRASPAGWDRSIAAGW